MKVLSISLLLLFFCSLAPLSAQDVPVAAEVQFPMLVKILTFDRNLPAKIHDTLVIGVLYQPQVKASRDMKDEFLDAADRFAAKRFFDLPIECVPLEADTEEKLVEDIRSLGIHVLYITPMRLFDLNAMLQIVHSEHVLTMTGVPQYVHDGVAIGIGERGGRPSILVNLTEAKAQGADLSAKLLKLAHIIP